MLHMLCILMLALPLEKAIVLGKVDIPTKQIAPGVHMPVISIGTGGWEMSNAYNITKYWLKLGGRGIDCAQMYSNQAEVAKAIADVGIDRKELFITTKISGCLNVKANVMEDLALLGVSYIDLLLIHFPMPMSSCITAWPILEDFHARGVLRSIGVSNFNKANLQLLMKIAKIKPSVNQIKYSITDYDDEAVNYAMDNGITTESWSPFRKHSWNGDISDNPALQSVASHHNVSTYQAAARWVIQNGHVLTFQSSSEKHQESDADIFNFALTADEMSRLDEQQSAADSQSALIF